MYKFELYCGVLNKDLLNIKSEEDYLTEVNFLFKAAKDLDLDITIIPSMGSYTNELNYTIEDSLVVIIIDHINKKRFVKELAYLYKNRFKQHAVLFTQCELKSELI